MEPIEIIISVVAIIAIIGPVITLYYTRKINQVDPSDDSNKHAK